MKAAAGKKINVVRATQSYNTFCTEDSLELVCPNTTKCRLAHQNALSESEANPKPKPNMNFQMPYSLDFQVFYIYQSQYIL